jgi:sarcosine oxidase subunit gamma
MLERRSALANAAPYKSDVLRMGEVRGFSLTQIAGFGKSFDKAVTSIAGKPPKDIGAVVRNRGRTLMRTGPQQWWIAGPENDDIASRLSSIALVTPLSHSRTRIVIEGAPARDVLAKGIPLDFHESAFTPGMFALTGLHHTPVLVHCTGEDRFELYVLRTFALSIWEWLCDAALEFAG